MRLSFFLCFSILSSFFLQNLHSVDLYKLPEPYCSLEKVLPFDSHGWYCNGPQIEKCINGHENIKTAIEIGPWLGASTRHIASLLQPDAKLYAVDWWFGCPETAPGGSHYNKEVYEKHATCYEQFLSNTIHANLTSMITPIRMESGDAANYLDVKADFIYLDATHSTEAVYRDIYLWYPKLKDDGIFCGDDWLWVTVQVAVNKFAEENDLCVYSEGNFWRLINR